MIRRLACLAFLACSVAHAQEEAVEVIGVTPVPGLGVPRDELPSNVQVLPERAISDAEVSNVPDLMVRRLQGVGVNEIQNNPFQPDITFRGFSASPLLGTPQGLSVFLDGARINAPFGDVVQWDLIPLRALDSMTLIPGSNPVFGANTLGGALALRTKSGERYRGLEAELQGGSFGRREAGFEYGARADSGAHFYAAATGYQEDGWRDFSPSDVRQLFAKAGKREGRLDFDVSVLVAETDLTGNGLAPESFLQQRREQIFTHPDNTRNSLGMLALSARYALGADQQIAGTLSMRRTRTHTLNGDANDDFEDGPDDLAAGGTGNNVATGVNNRTQTLDRALGLGVQWSRASATNRLAIGASLDDSRSDFQQSAEVGVFDPTRGVIATDPEQLENKLQGGSRTTGVFVSDTWSMTSALHLTLAGRYNATQVKLRDQGPGAPALDGDHSYSKFNPAAGLAWQASRSLTLYGGFAQSSRAPTPIELGCADPARPCTLPNALAADPPLNQVVAQTWEFGARGRVDERLRWNAGLFQTVSRDDILFVGTTTSAGYFTNFGKTQRRGAEMGASGSNGPLRWSTSYALVKATYQSSACIVSENNSSRGTSTDCSPEDPGAPGTFLGDDLIAVRPGDRIPGIPEHTVKVALDWQAAARLRMGFDVQAFSAQFARGNENNQHQAGEATDLNGDTRTFLGGGKVPGYTVANFSARFDLGGGWQLFGRIANLFDKRYSSGAALAENPFDAAGNFQTDSEAWTRETFLAPGAPRSFWIGVGYRG